MTLSNEDFFWFRQLLFGAEEMHATALAHPPDRRLVDGLGNPGRRPWDEILNNPPVCDWIEFLVSCLCSPHSDADTVQARVRKQLLRMKGRQAKGSSTWPYLEFLVRHPRVPFEFKLELLRVGITSCGVVKAFVFTTPGNTDTDAACLMHDDPASAVTKFIGALQEELRKQRRPMINEFLKGLVENAKESYCWRGRDRFKNAILKAMGEPVPVEVPNHMRYYRDVTQGLGQQTLQSFDVTCEDIFLGAMLDSVRMFFKTYEAWLGQHAPIPPNDELAQYLISSKELDALRDLLTRLETEENVRAERSKAAAQEKREEKERAAARQRELEFYRINVGNVCRKIVGVFNAVTGLEVNPEALLTEGIEGSFASIHAPAHGRTPDMQLTMRQELHLAHEHHRLELEAEDDEDEWTRVVESASFLVWHELCHLVDLENLRGILTAWEDEYDILDASMLTAQDIELAIDALALRMGEALYAPPPDDLERRFVADAAERRAIMCASARVAIERVIDFCEWSFPVDEPGEAQEFALVMRLLAELRVLREIAPDLFQDTSLDERLRMLISEDEDAEYVEKCVARLSDLYRRVYALDPSRLTFGEVILSSDSLQEDEEDTD